MGVSLKKNQQKSDFLVKVARFLFLATIGQQTIEEFFLISFRKRLSFFPKSLLGCLLVSLQ
jgi:hypothetical protein